MTGPLTDAEVAELGRCMIDTDRERELTERLFFHGCETPPPGASGLFKSADKIEAMLKEMWESTCFGRLSATWKDGVWYHERRHAPVTHAPSQPDAVSKRAARRARGRK